MDTDEHRAYRPTVAELTISFSQDYSQADIDLGPEVCPADLMYVPEGYPSDLPEEDPELDLDELFSIGQEILPAMMGNLVQAEGMAYRTQDPFWLSQAVMCRELYEEEEERLWGHIDEDGLTVF